MNKITAIMLLVAAAMVVGCANRNAKNTEQQAQNQQVDQSARQERFKNLADHYWDNFDFKDAMFVENDSIRGLAVAGYLQILAMNDSIAIADNVRATLEGCLGVDFETYELMSSTIEHYLYDPNSPMLNEELYIFFLRYIVDEAEVEDIYKMRPRAQLTMALKNRIGRPAADFEYTTDGGETSNLHSVEGEYTVIFFNDPICPDCERVKEYIETSELLVHMVEAGEISILAMCAEADAKAWAAASYPEVVINAYDKAQVLRSNGLYDLKAMPTLYLLDENKNVVLKDRPIEEIAGYLDHMHNHHHHDHAH